MITYSEQLTQSRQLLLDEINTMTDHEFNERHEEFTWSVAQVCQHILMAERLFHDAIKEALKTKGTEEELIHSQYISYEKCYNDSIKYKAPSYVQPELKQYSKNELINELQQCRLDLMVTLQSLHKPTLFERYVYPHYIFGPLTVGKWFELIAVHELRHIRQIKELKMQIVT